ncbi:caspase domain-containing protein [Thermodesulfobacteriota bacterium]
MRKLAIITFMIFFGSLFLPANLLAKQRGIWVKTLANDGSAQEIQLYSGYYALVVGCGDYRNGWPKLSNPVKDAREVASTFKIMGWEVDLLENPDWDRLDEALNRLITGPGKEKDHAILFWFSGHGHTLEEADDSKLGYIVPVDAPLPSKDEIGFMRRAINMRQIETVAKRIQAKHVLMVFDSCFSGAIFSMVRSAPSDYIEEKVAAPVREFIAAGRENEQVPDRSVFKTCFIQGINNGYADLNLDGYVSGEELGAYLQEKVINYSQRAQHPQFGKINNPRLDKGDFIFDLSGISGAVVGRPGEKEKETSLILEPKVSRKDTTDFCEGIKLISDGPGSDILASYFKSEAVSRGFNIYQETEIPGFGTTCQVKIHTNLGKPRSILKSEIQCWYVEASIEFMEKSTGKYLHLTLSDIHNIDNKIFGMDIEQALHGRGPNSLHRRIGEPFIRQFFYRLYDSLSAR